MVGSPVEINNRVSPSQAQFHNSVQVNVFASTIATGTVTVGHSKGFTNYLLTILLERRCRYFRLSTFPFFHRNSGRWGLTSGLE